jgi:hypothetical protein
MKALLFVLILMLPAVAFAEPDISFENPVHDFGVAKQGDMLTHTFEFSNTGTGDLAIEHVSAS